MAGSCPSATWRGLARGDARTLLDPPDPEKTEGAGMDFTATGPWTEYLAALGSDDAG